MKENEILLIVAGVGALYFLTRKKAAVGGTVARPLVGSSAPYKTPISPSQAQTLGAGLGGLVGGFLGSWSNSGGTVAKAATTDDATQTDAGATFGGVGAGYSWDGNAVPMIDGGSGTIGSFSDSDFA